MGFLLQIAAKKLAWVYSRHQSDAQDQSNKMNSIHMGFSNYTCVLGSLKPSVDSNTPNLLHDGEDHGSMQI